MASEPLAQSGVGKTTLGPGSVLGRYELIFEVATGGMASIWAARLRGSRGFQKLVAIKTLLPALSNNPNFEQMFLDEARLASRLKHPNVVQVIDLGEERDVLFQVMEWVNGVSLWWLLRAAVGSKRATREAGEPPIVVLVAARIVAQVCSGLHAAHELKGDDGQPLGLVHRDVSPQNVLVTPDGVAKVVDFGVAKYAGRGTAETKAGELRGKVPYMAPEHILGNPVDRRADVFALGVMLYQLLSGDHPFLKDDDRLTLARISSPVPAPPIDSRVSDLPDGLSTVIARALAKKPAQRTATAADLARELARILPDSAVQSSNDAVAAFVKELAGEQIERQTDTLKDSLRALETRASERDTAPALPAAVVPASARAVVPPIAPELASTSQTELSETLDVQAADTEDPPGIKGGHEGRRSIVLGAAAAFVAVVAFVALRSGGSPDNSEQGGAPPPRTESVPPAPAPTTIATSASPATATAATTAAATTAPASEASASPATTASASAVGTAVATARPTTAPSTSGATAVPVIKKPKEFTPSGL